LTPGLRFLQLNAFCIGRASCATSRIVTRLHHPNLASDAWTKSSPAV
jgi:hypothetical protein